MLSGVLCSDHKEEGVGDNLTISLNSRYPVSVQSKETLKWKYRDVRIKRDCSSQFQSGRIVLFQLSFLNLFPPKHSKSFISREWSGKLQRAYRAVRTTSRQTPTRWVFMFWYISYSQWWTFILVMRPGCACSFKWGRRTCLPSSTLGYNLKVND